MSWEDDLDRLVTERGSALVAYAYLLTGDLSAAEDLVQDGLVRTFGRRRPEDVVWVDYDAAVSMHRVLTTNPAERRLERLATPDVADNRISYGCINVPAAFYADVVLPLLRDTAGVVYILPETKPLKEVFQSYSAPQQQAYAH